MQMKPIPLESAASDAAFCPRAGVIVFRGSGKTLEFYLMLPKQKPHKPTPPDFQIAKGGRTILKLHNNGTQEYEDVRKLKELEKGMPLDPNIDGLREAMEEQGLRLDAIKTLYEIGKVEFISLSKGTPEPMWCLAAEVADKAKFDMPPDQKTERSEWFELSALQAAIKGKDTLTVEIEGKRVRTDHIKILIDFAGRLMRHGSGNNR